MKKLLTIVTLFLISGLAIAQKTEGKVIFEISYVDSDIPKDQQAMLPSEATLYFKNDKSRMEMTMGMGMKSVTLVEDHQITLLMDIMGNKMAVKSDEKRGNSSLKFNYTTETKTVAGYNCKKVIVTTSEGKDLVMWCTEEIQVNTDWTTSFNGIKGFPMEFSMNEKGVSMKMTASSVSLDKVNDTLFTIPSDYKIMTQDEMQRMFQGKN